MAYIAPNTDVYILRRVSLDKDYNHTVRQTSASTQANMFNSSAYKKYTLTTQTYQRAGENKIRVAILADNLYDCNYMMFRNTNFGSKWFYAFITKVTYINNNTTELEYKLDVMQSWYFDYELGNCFVEREHTITDVAGDNIVPENVEIGELVCQVESSVHFGHMLAGIVTSKSLPSSQPIYPNAPEYFIINTNFYANWDTSPCGVPNGLYVSVGYPIDGDEAENYWDGRTGYTMQDIMPHRTGGQAVYLERMHMSWLLEQIGLGNVQNMSIDDVVDVFLYPADLNLTTYIQNATTLNYKAGIAVSGDLTYTRPTTFKDTPSDTNPYTPKNQKMLTFPFVQLEVSNNKGNTATFKYEYFKNGSSPKFKFAGNYTSNPSVILYPIDYKGIENYFDGGLVLNNFPVPAYKGEQFARWLETNRNSVDYALISSIIGTSFSSLISVSSTASAGNSLSLLDSIGEKMARFQDIKNSPPQVCGKIGCDVLNTALLRNGFRLFHMTIRKEFARMIDNYFTMFGYAIKEVKVPNIRNNGVTLRPHWNYIKTAGCIIHAASLSGLPADAESEIAKIYDKGITFWNSLAEIGNYTLDNSPT